MGSMVNSRMAKSRTQDPISQTVGFGSVLEGSGFRGYGLVFSGLGLKAIAGFRV